MDPILLAGIIVIALLGAMTVFPMALRRRRERSELGLPHVGELAQLGLPPNEEPTGYRAQFRGAVTSESLAFESSDEDVTLRELDAVGRLIGFRQSFRDPRSYGEVIDVLLNRTLRAGKPHRMLALDIVLYEDAEGAADAVGEAAPSEPNIDGDGYAVEVSAVDGHGPDFADSVRRWSRRDPSGHEVQRKIEVRWRAGRIGCFVSGDAEPAEAIDASEVYRIAGATHQRVAASALVASPETAEAG